MGNLVELKKTSFVVLEKKGLVDVKANIVMIADTSGSTYHLYNSGIMQESMERLLGLGLNMDLNKSIEVFTFANTHTHIGNANEGNVKNFVKNVLLRKTSIGGGTRYAGVMNEVLGKFGKEIKFEEVTIEKEQGFFGKLFGKKPEVTTFQKPVAIEQSKVPTIVFFLTDGNNHDPAQTAQLIRETADQPVFWQFVGLGNESFEFLEMLDEMEGRFIDNANFFQLNDISKISDKELYERLLNEVPSWLKEAKEKNILA